MPDKLTDSEIVKDLNEAEDLENVLLYCKNPNKEVMIPIKITDIRDLINRLQAENEGLKEKSREDDKLLNDRVREAVNAVDKANQKYVDELERRIEDYKHLDVILHTAIDKLAKELKAEVCKEFAEKSNSIIDSLLEKYSVADFEEFKAICQVLRGLRNDTDDLLKEMVKNE